MHKLYTLNICVHARQILVKLLNKIMHLLDWQSTPTFEILSLLSTKEGKKECMYAPRMTTLAVISCGPDRSFSDKNVVILTIIFLWKSEKFKNCRNVTALTALVEFWLMDVHDTVEYHTGSLRKHDSRSFFKFIYALINILGLNLWILYIDYAAPNNFTHIWFNWRIFNPIYFCK